MAFYGFGSGTLWGQVAGSTPQRFGTLQDVQLDIDQTLKRLVGSNQFPVDLARGVGKITGKAKFGELNGALMASLYFNVATTVGQQSIAYAEAGTIPATPFQVTVTNGATFVRDLGVRYAATGLPLTLVASGTPTTGQYKVSNVGVYTFAAADTTLGVLIDYTYQPVTGGVSMQFTNQLLGIAPTFSLSLLLPRGAQQGSIYLPNCLSNKLTLPTKLEDYLIPEFDFEAFADATGNLIKMGLPA